MPWLVRYPAFALLVALTTTSGCKGGPSVPPTQAGPSPTLPTPPAATPRNTVTVSGAVFEHTPLGIHPLPGLRLRLVAFLSGVMDVTSDSQGRYSIAGVPVGTVSIAPAANTGYLAPCPSGTDDLKANMTIDAHVVSVAQLGSSGTPQSLPIGSIWTSGLVVERTAGETRPVAGAIVELGSNPNLSTTVTSGAGRYVICTSVPGTGTDIQTTVSARKDNYLPAFRTVTLGSDVEGVDLVLARR